MLTTNQVIQTRDIKVDKLKRYQPPLILELLLIQEQELALYN